MSDDGEGARPALAVFRDDGETTHPLARFLRMKHVFCVIDDGRGWIRTDALDDVPFSQYVAPNDTDLATIYRGLGWKVLSGTLAGRKPPGLVSGNCVGLVKAFLGVRSWAITPYGLYKYLRKSGWT